MKNDASIEHYRGMCPECVGAIKAYDVTALSSSIVTQVAAVAGC